LPIPELDDTLSRYLQTIQPLTTPDEFTGHESLVRDFQKSTGLILHEKLVAKDTADAASGGYPFSYIEKQWDDMYFGGRWETPINSNPFYLLNSAPDSHAHLNAQIPRAAAFITSSLNWWRKIRTGNLEFDRGDMTGYALQFGTGRVARPGRDELRSDFTSGHIVVASNGHFYKVQVLGDGGSAQLSCSGLEQQLRSIRADSLEGPAGDAVGALTTGERDLWGAQRLALEGHAPGNAASLRDIDTSLMVVSLEAGGGPAGIKANSELMLHEGGRAGGRWYDKHCAVFFEDGAFGMNFEHSFSDGMTWNRWMQETWSDMHGTASPYSSPLPCPDSEVNSFGADEPAGRQRLEWDLTDGMRTEISAAKAAFQATVSNLDTDVLSFSDFGKSELKTWKMSPDCVVQVGLQLAFHRLHGGQAPPTYESCSTRGFLRGRTETIRSCTSDSAAFAQAMLDPSVGKAERRGLFVTAVGTQLDQAKAAAGGMGVDRHFKALASIAAEDPDTLSHELFDDEIFARSSSFRISSSNVTMPFYDLFGFGPVVGDGYGVGYLILDDSLPFNITCFKSSGMRASDMSSAVEASLLELRDLQD
jgi:hypothetical protein